MSSYILSPAAQESLIQIKAYSIKHFGKARTTLYLQDIANRLKGLSMNPYHGQSRPEIKTGF